MNRTLKFLIYLALSLSAEAVAQNENGDPIATSRAEAKEKKEKQIDFFPVEESASLPGFRTLRDTNIPTVEDGRDGALVSIPAGLELVVLEKKWHEHYGILVRLGLEAEENFGLPAELWAQERDLHSPDLVPQDFSGGESDFEIMGKMTYCYRYVKRYLLQTGQVKSYLPGGSAYQAASVLPKFGFHRSGRGPKGAHNGEVCVYGGGPQGHGHIEVKRNGKWWYGYGFINHPIANRRFIACFVK